MSILDSSVLICVHPWLIFAASENPFRQTLKLLFDQSLRNRRLVGPQLEPFEEVGLD